MTQVVTLTDALRIAARSPLGIKVIEHDGRLSPLSYRSLLDDSLLLGGALRSRGLASGDRVALVTPETGDFIRAFFAISAAGLVPVPLVPPAQAADLLTFTRQSHHLLAASRAAAVVTSPDVAALLDVSGLEPSAAVLTVDELEAGPALAEPVTVEPGATALLQFTSGSTAAPKGVVLSHASLYANVTAIRGPAGLNICRGDVSVSWLPLYHDMGLIGMLITSMYAVVDVVIMSPVVFLKRPTSWLEAISDHRGTISFAPNFAYDLCVRRVKPAQIDAIDLSSWRIAGCGAEPVRARTLQRFAVQFDSTGFRRSSFVPSYGLAEHALAVTLAVDGIKTDRVDAARLVRESLAVPIASGSAAGTPGVDLVACGKPFPGHAVQIVDDQGRALPERHVGRILARGPSVMNGYFEDATGTAEVLHEGWLHTGDLGYLADGELYICGRTKDLIIRHGRKYHSPDLESAITEVQGVRPSAVVVFGISRVEEADEVVAVLEARASLASRDFADRVRRRVRETAGLELDHVIVAPPGTIPRTTSGKVRRAEARARFEAGTLLSSGRAS
jgi:acyl-CoA synthetase (AMP-forming)/AMP-acid ligase II